MNFFNNLFSAKGDQPQKQLTANEVLKATTFVKPESQLLIDEEGELGFLSKDNVCYSLRLFPAPDWPFDLRELDGAKEFYGNQCAENKGAMLFLDLVKVDGVEALTGTFKYRSPDNPMAIAYVGIIWVPFMEACLQINVEAVEQGMTGMREALIAALMMQDGTFEEQQSFEPPVEVNSAQEMFKLMGEKPLRIIASDDEKWDEKIPGHPLTLVRKNLRTAVETLKLEPSMHKLRPYRFG